MHRGQASLLVVILMTGFVVILGAVLAGYFSTYAARIRDEQATRNMIQSEIANTFVYKEFYRERSDGVKELWLGLIRIDGSSGLYYILILNTSTCGWTPFTQQDIALNVINGTASNLVGFSIDSSNVYILGQDGVHYPIKSYYSEAQLTMYRLYVKAAGDPVLIGPLRYRATAGCIQIVFFISINNNYYEVAHIYA